MFIKIVHADWFENTVPRTQLYFSIVTSSVSHTFSDKKWTVFSWKKKQMVIFIFWNNHLCIYTKTIYMIFKTSKSFWRYRFYLFDSRPSCNLHNQWEMTFKLRKRIKTFLLIGILVVFLTSDSDIMIIIFKVLENSHWKKCFSIWRDGFVLIYLWGHPKNYCGIRAGLLRDACLLVSGYVRACDNTGADK